MSDRYIRLSVHSYGAGCDNDSRRIPHFTVKTSVLDYRTVSVEIWLIILPLQMNSSTRCLESGRINDKCVVDGDCRTEKVFPFAQFYDQQDGCSSKDASGDEEPAHQGVGRTTQALHPGL